MNIGCRMNVALGKLLRHYQALYILELQMPAECGRMSLIHCLWSASGTRVKNVRLRCEATAVNLCSDGPTELSLFGLLILDFKCLDFVKHIQMLESKDFNLVSFALCFFQLLLP